MTKKVYYFIYTLFEYIAFTSLLYFIIRNNKFKKLILICSILFIGFMIVNYLVTSYKRMDSVPIGVSTILLFIYIFYYLFNSLKEIENKSLYKGPELWFVTAMLIYLGSTFFFFILANSLDSQFMIDYWHFSFLGDIVKNILFAIGLVLYVKTSERVKKENSTVDHRLWM